MNRDEIITHGRATIEDDTPCLSPAEIARFDQAAAQLRDQDSDGVEEYREALDALERCTTLEEERLCADVMYVAALVFTGGPSATP